MVNKTVCVKELRNITKKKSIALNLNAVSSKVAYCEDVTYYHVLMLNVW